RVLRDITFDAEVVAGAALPRQAAALLFHFVGRLPGAGDDFADAAHGLRIRAHHADRAEVVEDVLGRDGFATDAALCEGDVLWQTGIEVVADHQHVQVFVDGIHRVG